MSNKGISVDTKGNVHVDDAFLQAYVDKGGKVETAQGADTTDELLKEVGKDQKSATRSADALHKEVEKQQNAEQKATDKQTKEDAKAQKQAEDAAKKLNLKRIGIAEKAANTVKKATDPMIKNAGHAVDRASRVRTVGGVAGLLMILMFLLFIVVEVNAHGDTRIKQLWYMLVGRAALVGRRTIIPNATPGKDNSNSFQQLLGAAALSSIDPTGLTAAAINSTVNNIENSFRSASNDMGF